MESLPGVVVLVQMRPVEVPERVPVGGEVGGDPVEDHPDAALMQPVDQVHEVLRRSVPAGGGEVSRRLVPPRAVEGMLHHREQLHVREAHVGAVVGEVVGQLTGGRIGEPLPRKERQGRFHYGRTPLLRA